MAVPGVSGPAAEVDVLGMRAGRSALVGEAKWQERPLGRRDVATLQMKAAAVPDVIDDPLLVLWGRGGIEADLRTGQVRGYDLAEMLA